MIKIKSLSKDTREDNEWGYPFMIHPTGWKEWRELETSLAKFIDRVGAFVYKTYTPLEIWFEPDDGLHIYQLVLETLVVNPNNINWFKPQYVYIYNEEISGVFETEKEDLFDYLTKFFRKRKDIRIFVPDDDTRNVIVLPEVKSFDPHEDTKILLKYYKKHQDEFLENYILFPVPKGTGLPINSSYKYDYVFMHKRCFGPEPNK